MGREWMVMLLMWKNEFETDPSMLPTYSWYTPFEVAVTKNLYDGDANSKRKSRDRQLIGSVLSTSGPTYIILAESYKNDLKL